MRKKHLYLLYILPSEEESQIICGQVKEISTGETVNFHGIEELNAIISQETLPHKIGEKKAPYTTGKTN